MLRNWYVFSHAHRLRLPLAHKGIYPNLGNVEKLARQFWYENGKWTASSWDEAIPVRCFSEEDPPEVGKYELLGSLVCLIVGVACRTVPRFFPRGDVMIMAFDFAWGKALETGDKDALKAFASCASSVKVKFTWLPNQLDFEIKKWVRLGCKSGFNVHSVAVCVATASPACAAMTGALWRSRREGGHANIVRLEGHYRPG